MSIRFHGKVKCKIISSKNAKKKKKDSWKVSLQP